MLQVTVQIIYLFFAFKISISDLRYRLILNRDLLFFLIFSIALHFSRFTVENLKSLTFISLTCAALHIIFDAKIGAGDLKLLWVISFWTSSFTQWLESLTITWLLGGLFAISYGGYFYLRGSRKRSIPFAPFIFLGFLACR